MVRTKSTQKSSYDVLHGLVRNLIGYGRAVSQEQVTWLLFSSPNGFGAGVDVEKVLKEMVELKYFQQIDKENSSLGYLLLRNPNTKYQLKEKDDHTDYSKLSGLSTIHTLIKKSFGYGRLFSENDFASLVMCIPGLRFAPGSSTSTTLEDLIHYKYVLDSKTHPENRYLLLALDRERRPITRCM